MKVCDLTWSSSKRFLSLLPVFEPESTESRSSSQIYNFMTLFLLVQHKKRLRIKIHHLKIIRNPNKFSLLTRLIPITAESSQTSSSSQGLHRIEFPSQNFPVLAETLSSNQSGRFLWLTLPSCGVQQSDSDWRSCPRCCCCCCWCGHARLQRCSGKPTPLLTIPAFTGSSLTSRGQRRRLYCCV